MADKSRKTTYRALNVLPIFVVGLFAFSLLLEPALAAGGIDRSLVIELTNKARIEHGQSALVENQKLSEAAAAKARDMIKNDYFAHTSPAGKDPWYWVKQAGYSYKAAGENLAINFDDAKEQQSAWMKSQTHRDNILNSQYREIGVAVVEGKIKGKTSTVTVQIFGTPLVAVADRQVSPLPIEAALPESVPAPEVKGVETESIVVPPAPVLRPQPSRSMAVPDQDMPIWIERAWLAVLGLLIGTAVAGPLIVAVVTLRKTIRSFVEHTHALRLELEHTGK